VKKGASCCLDFVLGWAGSLLSTTSCGVDSVGSHQNKNETHKTEEHKACDLHILYK